MRLMQRVPYEGVSRMQTSLRRKHRDRVVRRGLALIIESDFVRSRPPRIHSHHAHHKARLTLAPLARAQYATDAGRQHFADRASHTSNPTTPFSPFQAPTCAMVVVRRAHVDSVLRPGDLQCAPRL